MGHRFQGMRVYPINLPFFVLGVFKTIGEALCTVQHQHLRRKKSTSEHDFEFVSRKQLFTPVKLHSPMRKGHILFQKKKEKKTAQKKAFTHLYKSRMN